MSHHKSSIDALYQLLHLGISDGEINDGREKNSITNRRITKQSEDVLYTKNGMEYCFIEVTCSDGTQYGLHAYGEEAKELYRESHRAAALSGSQKVSNRTRNY